MHANQNTIANSTQGNQCMLRIKVDSGGCHGYQYGFELTDALGVDDIVYRDRDSGAVFLVDGISYPYLAGVKLDYVDELIGSAFKVADNPNASSECGCKISFQAKDSD